MQRVTSQSKSLVDENPFGLSMGDLMAGLLLIFVLLLSFLMLDLMEKKKSQKETVEKYQLLREKLYLDLKREFQNDLQKWKAVLDRENLSVRFREPKVLFEQGKSEVQLAFKEILNDFFPRYIRILRQKHYINEISEIRIEGHTSSEWSGEISQEDSYILNMELSQDRTRSVLQYVLSISEIAPNRVWIKMHLTANGLSSSKLIESLNGKENPEESRRVEFRVRTNIEKVVDELLGEDNAISERNDSAGL